MVFDENPVHRTLESEVVTHLKADDSYAGNEVWHARLAPAPTTKTVIEIEYLVVRKTHKVDFSSGPAALSYSHQEEAEGRPFLKGDILAPVDNPVVAKILNYFIYPHLEVDGKKYKDFSTRFYFSKVILK